MEAIQEEVQRNLRKQAELRNVRNMSWDCKLKIGDWVLLREDSTSDGLRKQIYKLCPLFSGPYKISANTYTNVYTLVDPATQERKGNYNITNLKYCYRI